MLRCLLVATLGAAVIEGQPAPVRKFEAEYISGRTDLPKKKLGILTIEDSILVFTSYGDSVFAIPLRRVREVSNQADVRDASVGSKLLFGHLAGSRKQDFVSVRWESEADAEVIVWKVKQNTGANIATKIRFAAKQLTGTEPAGGAQPTNPVPPAG